jgi:hypothetical protein
VIVTRPRLTAVCLTIAAACDLSVDVNRGWRETMGYITDDDGPAVSVPDSALVGIPFKIEFMRPTGPCSREAPTNVVLTANRANVEPRIMVPHPPPQTCNSGPGGVSTVPVMIRFDQPGPATVAIRAIWTGRGSASGDTVTIERTVIMRR